MKAGSVYAVRLVVGISIVGLLLVGCVHSTQPNAAQQYAAQAQPTTQPKYSDAQSAATSASESPKAKQAPPLPKALVPIAAAFEQLWVEQAPAQWLALFDPAASIQWGRRAEPDAHDVTFDVESYAVFWRYQLEGLAPGYGGGVELRDVALVQSERDPQLSVYEWTADVDVPGFVTELMRYRASLREQGGSSKIMRLRQWPLRATMIGDERLFDAAKLSDYDAKANAVAADKPREKAEACRQALRFAEAADWYEKVVTGADATAHDWLSLGWACVFAGRFARAEQAFTQARKMDPTMPMPGDR